MINKLISFLRHFNRSQLDSESAILNSLRPRSCGIEMINICNANCSFCGYGKGKDGKASDPRKKRKFDIEAYKHLLKLYDNAGGGKFSLNLYW